MSTPIFQVNAMEEFQAQFGQVPLEPGREGQQWVQMCQKLLEENDRLRQEMARIQEERDQFYKAVVALMRPRPEELQFTKEEISRRWEKVLACKN